MGHDTSCKRCNPFTHQGIRDNHENCTPRLRTDASHIQTACSSPGEEYLPDTGNYFQDKIHAESRLISVILCERELTAEFELNKSSTPDPNSSSISVSVP